MTISGTNELTSNATGQSVMTYCDVVVVGPWFTKLTNLPQKVWVVVRPPETNLGD